MKISTKLTPITLCLETTRGKHYAVSIADTPGHPNFVDEVVAGMRLADGVVLVVDLVEGPLLSTELAVKAAAWEGLPIVLVLNKLDRLIVELKLPPRDAYFKIRHVLEEVNQLVHKYIPKHPRLSPEVGNVLFAAPEMGYCFTLESFARMYIEYFFQQQPEQTEHDSGSAFLHKVAAAANAAPAPGFTPEEFAKRLWGELYYHPETRQFLRTTPDGDGASRLLRTSERSFVQFVLEPLYKIYSAVVGEERDGLEPLMNELGIKLTASDYTMNVRSLLKLVFSTLFGEATAFADMVVRFLPSPVAGAPNKVKHTYTGPIPEGVLRSVEASLEKGDSSDVEMEEEEDGVEELSAEEREEAAAARRVAGALLRCDTKGPLSMNVVKLVPKPDATGFDALCRVLSGRVREGMDVMVLGEGYSTSDHEASARATVHRVKLSQARYALSLSSAPAGAWVLLEGVEESIAKSATIIDEDEDLDRAYIYRPLHFGTQSVIKIAVEPLNPSELPKMVEGLRKVNASYPLVVTKKEENGEHIIIGMGELYLDCVMRDLRTMFCDIEIKVSDPIVSFCETVDETSSFKCFATTLNKQNRLNVIAEPLEQGLAKDIERGHVRLDWEPRRIVDFFRGKYHYDGLAARSVWAFGPSEQGPNMLLNDTLPTEVDQGVLMTAKRNIVQGFQWATREGPLCEEPIRSVKFKLVDAVLASDEVGRSGAQIIPTARRVCYAALLLSRPRLMEPYLYVECYCPDEYVPEVEKVLKGGSASGFRRGYVDRFDPIPGTPLTRVRAYIPAIDSFGLETNLRQWTLGQAFCLQMFDHWKLVPGDPFDTSVKLNQLEPAKNEELAREFMVKTRRRKGLSDRVNARKFFDEEMIHTKEFESLLGQI